jgi:hypothetical protein
VTALFALLLPQGAASADSAAPKAAASPATSSDAVTSPEPAADAGGTVSDNGKEAGPAPADTPAPLVVHQRHHRSGWRHLNPPAQAPRSSSGGSQTSSGAS